jgi:xanthine dehydrogenase YagR molybdenum-binding subunit
MTRSVGRPMSRADGPAKVTGQARYAADTPLRGMAHAVLVMAPIAHGRIRRLDAGAARAEPGVLAVLSHADMPKLNRVDTPPAAQSVMPLQSDEIVYEGQPVAVVVAETLEQAQHAAALVRVDYAAEPAVVDLRAALDEKQRAPIRIDKFEQAAASDTRVGDVDAAVRGAPVVVEATYHTADRHHSPMEPSATVASWNGDRLEMVEATQWVWGVRMSVSAALGIAPEQVRVRSPFTGGAFGCKGHVWPHQFLAALAARAVKRPVKLVLTRAHTFTSHGYQPASRQSVTLAADRRGVLLGIRHASITVTPERDDFLEFAAIGTRSMYACKAIETSHRALRLHRGSPAAMRAPWEGLSMVGLECAMDELAEKLDMDPLALRVKNHAPRDPTSGKPFSAKALLACYERGAELFGWSKRPRRPRSMSDGHDLIGWGMASAIMSTFRFPATARATLEPGGRFLLEAGTQEIGTGVYTIMPQIAADALGVPVERVRLVLGDTTLPEAGPTYGSSTTVGVGSAVLDAATKLRDAIAGAAGGEMPPLPEALDAILRRSGKSRLSAEGRWAPDKGSGPLGDPPDWSMNTYGAVFAEVRVDRDLCIPRVTRMVGVYSAGRIINPMTARSQISGGMIWGIGQALLEHSTVDRSLGRYLSKNLAGYLMPVNADVPEPVIEFIDEVDRHACPLGGKGIGELGAVGIGPAIANAVWHATGIRARELPIVPEMLLAT